MRCVRLALLALLVLVPGLASADEDHHHETAAPERLGTVHFWVTARPSVQRDFNRAVALLHSFEYEQAEKAFRLIVQAEPKLAMGYWGIAMCNYHPIWGPTTSVELERGRLAAARAARLKVRTDRERAYIAAIGAYYKGAKVDYPARNAAFEQAMERFHQHYPDDMEGTVFYALAILGTAPTTDKTYTMQKKAADLLNSVLSKAPDHPGVAHYLIHSLDYPELAALALPAARAYSKIAPSAPHAQHMPSHIFTRLGYWEESIQSNLASAEASRELMAKTNPGSTYFEELHAMDYLEYAYLQLGQEDKAKGVVDAMAAVSKVNQPTLSAAYAFAASPARYALERRQWAEAKMLTVSPRWFPWNQFPGAEAGTHFARGIGAARSGDVEAAKTELTSLDAIHEKLAGVKERYSWADQVEVQRLALQGWIARAEKRDDEALRELRSAADLEDSIDKNPVTPGAVIPAREQLADLLGELGRYTDASAEYETVLKSAPGRKASARGLELAKRGTSPATDPSSLSR
ncbi:MAG: hypothetical protein E6K77_01805 [Candidatus Eisenbacteria bacterium]|uniref:Tetratricopeptide repeat protein n=1 Tax=Eiseniibacteriota bacterium TaxID=2212470 RepID=A0A538TR70_UNCEI|nr:MAG: hypothetical protein E6K77_01805 [Candidatus Eisenbacteria bacterium]